MTGEEGVLYAAPIPECPVHKARLHYKFDIDTWTCGGYDGEGCDYTVTAAEMMRTMQIIGTVGAIQWKPGGPYS
jgi:hypothetical protein